jgi:hypothetical protein
MSELKAKEIKPTIVKVDLQYVRNLGNFESVRVAIGVEDHVRGRRNCQSGNQEINSICRRQGY